MSPILSARGGMSAGAYGWGALSAAAGNFVSIASAVGTGSSGVITLSSIPSTYKHLQLRIVTAATSGSCEITVNGVTSGYSRHVLRGSNNSGMTYFGQVSASMLVNLFPGGISTTPSCAIIDFLDYANINKYKTIRSISGQASTSSGYFEISGGAYQSGTAISSITVTNSAASWNSSTSVSLYGITGV